MTQRRDLEEFLTLAVRERLYANQGNLHFFMRSIFGGAALEGARVLDIGGGTGLCSYYAAARGAKKAVCLEPEADGGTRTAHEGFRRLASLGFSERVQLKCTTLQDYDGENGESGGFDVVLLHNSINHLDESACAELHRSESAREAYRGILSRIHQRTRDQGRLIVCDCARHNFFPDAGMRHPLCPNIEWHKHQSPKCWAKLFSEVGFHSPRITWSSFNTLRGAGRVLLGNRIASYFLCSDFRIEMRKGSQS